MIVDASSARTHRRRRSPLRSHRTVWLAVAVATTAAVGFGGEAYGGFDAARPAVVQVRPGESLWSIAAGHYSSGDPRDRVAAIQAANHLQGNVISAGQILVLPAP